MKFSGNSSFLLFLVFLQALVFRSVLAMASESPTITLHPYQSCISGNFDGGHECLAPSDFMSPPPVSEVTFKSVARSTHVQHEESSHSIHHAHTGTNTRAYSGNEHVSGRNEGRELASSNNCEFGSVSGSTGCILPSGSKLETPPPGSEVTFLPTQPLTTPVTSPTATFSTLTMTAPFPLQTPAGWIGSLSTSTLIASGSPYSVTLISMSTYPSSFSSSPTTTIHTVTGVTTFTPTSVVASITTLTAITTLGSVEIQTLVSGSSTRTLTLTESPSSSPKPTTKTSGAAAAYTNPKSHQIDGLGVQFNMPVRALVVCLLACVLQGAIGF